MVTFTSSRVQFLHMVTKKLHTDDFFLISVSYKFFCFFSYVANVVTSCICLCLPSDRTWHKVNGLMVGFKKGLVEGKVRHELDFVSHLLAATYWPPAFLAIAALLSRSPSVWSWFSRWHLISKTLTPTPELPVAPGYIIVWHSPASCECHICTEFNPSTVKAIPWYLRPDATMPWLTAGPICYNCAVVGLWMSSIPSNLIL